MSITALTDGWDLPRPLIFAKGPQFYTPEAYGAVGGGVTDDTVAIQAMQNAMGASPSESGIALISQLHLISSAITMSARGSYLYMGANATPSLYDLNDGYPANRPGFVVPISPVGGLFGNQPAAFGLNSTNIFFMFDCTPATAHGGGGELSVAFTNLIFNLPSLNYNKPLCIAALTKFVRTFYMADCETSGLGIAYIAGFAGGAQLNRFVLRDSHLAGGWIWGDGHAPFLGVIYNNIVALAASGEGLLPMPHGEFLEQNTFFTWLIHHNLFNGVGASLAAQRSVIYSSGITQSNFGSIDHNTFFYPDGGCIYWQDNSAFSLSLTGPLLINDNIFFPWNVANVGGIAAASIYVDHSTGSPPAQEIVIGANSYEGNAGGAATSTYGIVTVDDPVAANVAIAGVTSPGFPGEFRGIVTAPWRLNGVNYGQAGSNVKQFTFDGKASYAANATLNTTDRVVEATGGAGGITLTAATLAAGQGNTSVVVTKVDAGVGSVTITGITGTNIVLSTQWASQRLTWDGTQWLRA